MNTRIEKNLGWTRGIVGIAIGALGMYFSDPDRGRRRRALVRDQIHHWIRETASAIDVATRDLGNRLTGVRARARNMVSRQHPVPDIVLEERVRAHLGRATSHPRAIKVAAQGGWVNLSGAVLQREKEDVLDAVRATLGVTGIADNMQVYETAEHIPSLQGNHNVLNSRSMFIPSNWTPATRALAAIGGCTLGCYGLVRRAPVNIALVTIGFGLLATGMMTNTRGLRRRHEIRSEREQHEPRQKMRARVTASTEEIARSMETETTTEPAGAQPQPASPQSGSLLH